MRSTIRERAFFICCDVVNRGVALYRGKVAKILNAEQVHAIRVYLIARAVESAKPAESQGK